MWMRYFLELFYWGNGIPYNQRRNRPRRWLPSRNFIWSSLACSSCLLAKTCWTPLAWSWSLHFRYNASRGSHHESGEETLLRKSGNTSLPMVWKVSSFVDRMITLFDNFGAFELEYSVKFLDGCTKDIVNCTVSSHRMHERTHANHVSIFNSPSRVWKRASCFIFPKGWRRRRYLETTWYSCPALC